MAAPNLEASFEFNDKSHEVALRDLDAFVNSAAFEAYLDKGDSKLHWVPSVVEARVMLARRAVDDLHEERFVREERKLALFLAAQYGHLDFIPSRHREQLAALQALGCSLFAPDETIGRMSSLITHDTLDAAATKGIMQLYAESNSSPQGWINNHRQVSLLVAWAHYHEAACEHSLRTKGEAVGTDESNYRIREVADMLRPDSAEVVRLGERWPVVCRVLARYAPVPGIGDQAVEFVQEKCRSNPQQLIDEQSFLDVASVAIAVLENPNLFGNHNAWLRDVIAAGDKFTDAASEALLVVTAKLDVLYAFRNGFASTVVEAVKREYCDAAESDQGHPAQASVLLEMTERYLQQGDITSAVEVAEAIGPHKTWATAVLRFSTSKALASIAPRNLEVTDPRLRLYSTALHIADIANYEAAAQASAVSIMRFIVNSAEMELLRMNDGELLAEFFDRLASAPAGQEAAAELFEQIIYILQNEEPRRIRLVTQLCAAAAKHPSLHKNAVETYRRLLLSRRFGGVGPAFLYRLLLFARMTNPDTRRGTSH